MKTEKAQELIELAMLQTRETFAKASASKFLKPADMPNLITAMMVNSAKILQHEFRFEKAELAEIMKGALNGAIATLKFNDIDTTHKVVEMPDHIKPFCFVSDQDGKMLGKKDTH